MARGRSKRRTGREDLRAVLADMLEGRPEVRPGLMFGFPAFYAAGKLVACVYGSGVVLRLAPEEASELRGLPSRAFEPYGRRMRAWTFLEPAAPEELRRETAALQAAIDRARRDGGPEMSSPRSEPSGTRPEWVPDGLHPFADRYIELDGARVHYIDEGEGPPLLLLSVWE